MGFDVICCDELCCAVLCCAVPCCAADNMDAEQDSCLDEEEDDHDFVAFGDEGVEAPCKHPLIPAGQQGSGGWSDSLAFHVSGAPGEGKATGEVSLAANETQLTRDPNEISLDALEEEDDEE